MNTWKLPELAWQGNLSTKDKRPDVPCKLQNSWLRLDPNNIQGREYADGVHILKWVNKLSWYLYLEGGIKVN